MSSSNQSGLVPAIMFDSKNEVDPDFLVSIWGIGYLPRVGIILGLPMVLKDFIFIDLVHLKLSGITPLTVAILFIQL